VERPAFSVPVYLRETGLMPARESVPENFPLELSQLGGLTTVMAVKPLTVCPIAGNGRSFW